MELGWGALALICIIAACAWLWQDSLAARERANAAAMDACQRLNLQFLDGTVAFARARLTRELGWLTLQRTYVFDYTANSIERRQGFVLLTGRRVDSVGYEGGEASGPRAAGVAPSPREAGAAPVLRIEDYRREPKSAPPDDAPAERSGEWP